MLHIEAAALGASFRWVGTSLFSHFGPARLLQCHLPLAALSPVAAFSLCAAGQSSRVTALPRHSPIAGYISASSFAELLRDAF